MVIQPVLKIKDGMDLHVSKLNVHQTPITMEPSVFAQTQEIVACPGSIMMVFNVFINQEHVLQEPLGTEPSVSLIQVAL